MRNMVMICLPYGLSTTDVLINRTFACPAISPDGKSVEERERESLLYVLYFKSNFA